MSKTQWQAPKRPDWLQKLNDEGNLLDLINVVPLMKVLYSMLPARLPA